MLPSEKFLEKIKFKPKKNQFWGGNINSNSSVIPIQSFKYDDLTIYKNKKSLKYFFSSSGTMGEQSISRFSEEGLLLYKASAIKTFAEVLKQLKISEKDIHILSFVPSTKKWPHSSLAQMIQWFLELWSGEYVNEKKLKGKINKEKTNLIWGTALHFHKLLESNFCLPRKAKNVFIFETGGMKNAKIEISKKEFYQNLSRAFRIQEHQIISEYGMSELASQGYDFITSKNKSKQRFFRFPFWCDVKVMNAYEQINSNGVGAITIRDNARIDLKNVSIRLQDVGELKNHKLNLMGRIPNSPLKGCSTHVDI